MNAKYQHNSLGIFESNWIYLIIFLCGWNGNYYAALDSYVKEKRKKGMIVVLVNVLLFHRIGLENTKFLSMQLHRFCKCNPEK